jgi:UDPglucose 6-dehydrogenase
MIGFVGLSHLGLVSGISLASKGFEIVGFDPDEALIGDLKEGRLPVFEPQLPELLADSKDRIRFTSSPSELSACDVVYVAIDVKTSVGNQSDLTPLNALIDRILPHLKKGTSLIIHSQVPPGFTRKLQETLDTHGLLGYYQVETLIFGRAVERALHPERYIVGCGEVTENLPPPYAKLLAAFNCPLLRMRYESAEFCKLSLNMFLISTVTVTNMLSEVCEKIGADWSEIAPAIRLDRRIGPHAYLSPGLGLSGGNLERDLATINKLGHELGADVAPAIGFERDSIYRRDWALRQVHAQVLARISDPTLAVWGLAYKPGTRSTKNSPAITLLEQLKGIAIRSYDPQVRLDPGYPWVTPADTPLDACRGADALVLMTPWDEFSDISVSTLCEHLRTRVIIDPFGVLVSKIREPGLRIRYCRLGVRSDGEGRLC